MSKYQSNVAMNSTSSYGFLSPQRYKGAKKQFKWTRLIIIMIIVLLVGILAGRFFSLSQPHPRMPFIASIDTMKVSRDTLREPLSTEEIRTIVALSASLGTNYITVDTQWDHPDYMAQWIHAIRLAGRHVWFRIHPDQWENTNGSTGIMTPAQYMTSEEAFIEAHPSFFQPADILDPCPEAEQGLYWKAIYGQNWTRGAPNKATAEYNRFLRQTTDTANIALQRNGINGVVTTVRSINSFIATHRSVLEQATVDKFGSITVDSYPDQDTTDPKIAAQARVAELQQIEELWQVPIIVGEMGYSNHIAVDDTTQQAVLKEELSQMQALSYLVGVNYWVGAGSEVTGGYTYILTQKDNVWVLRPAAYDLSAFYRKMQRRQ
jgi:hypothetical protein